MLVLLLSARLGALASEHQHSFTAFDCDQPKEVSRAAIPVDCQPDPDQVKLGQPVNISLYQRVQKTKQGIRCKVQRSEWISYCGVWSHQSLLTPGKVLRPVKISAKECLHIHKEGTWVDGAGQAHKVLSEGITYLNFIEAGTLTYYDNKISCTGVTVHVEGGETYNRAVKLVDMRIEITKVEVVKNDEGYVLAGVPLPMKGGGAEEEGVDMGPGGTLVLEDPQPGIPARCHLRKLGHLTVQAQRTKEENGFSQVLFNRKHKIYLLRRNRSRLEPGCSKERIWETNLENVFVRKEADLQRGARDYLTGEGKIQASLVNQVVELRDFTAAELKMELERARLRETCLRYLSAVNGRTVGFQQGHAAGEFTQIQGELATTIKCNKVSVRHKEGERECFEDLPVRYLGEDRFLEPISRILKRTSAKCSCHEAPVVISQEGLAISMRPNLTKLSKTKEMRLGGKLQVDTAEGEGVYPAAALEAAQHLLQGRWNHEEEIRKGRWDISQPIWHPTAGSGEEGWSISDLFRSHAWIIWTGKGLTAALGLYLTWQGSMWVTGLVGACRGARLASPATSMSAARRTWEVAKGMMNRHYSDGMRRGHQAVHRGADDAREGAENLGGQPFHIAPNSQEV